MRITIWTKRPDPWIVQCDSCGVGCENSKFKGVAAVQDRDFAAGGCVIIIKYRETGYRRGVYEVQRAGTAGRSADEGVKAAVCRLMTSLCGDEAKAADLMGISVESLHELLGHQAERTAGEGPSSNEKASSL